MMTKMMMRPASQLTSQCVLKSNQMSVYLLLNSWAEQDEMMGNYLREVWHWRAIIKCYKYGLLTTYIYTFKGTDISTYVVILVVPKLGAFLVVVAVVGSFFDTVNFCKVAFVSFSKRCKFDSNKCQQL